MKDLILLKIACQLSFYFAIVSFLVAIFSGANLGLIFPVFLGIVYLTVWLKSKGIFRYVPLLLVGICFLIIPFEWYYIVFLVPPFVYAIFAADYVNGKSSKHDYSEPFKRAIVTFVALLFLALLYSFTPLDDFIRAILVGQYTPGSRHFEVTPTGFYIAQALQSAALPVFIRTTLPMFVIYLWSSVMLLRIQAYEVEAKGALKLKIINAVSIIATIIGALVVGLIVAVGVSLISLPHFNLNVERSGCEIIFPESTSDEPTWHCQQWDHSMLESSTFYLVDCWCENDSRLDEASPLFIGEWFVYQEEIPAFSCGIDMTFYQDTYLYLVTDTGYERFITSRGYPVRIAHFYWCETDYDSFEGRGRQGPALGIILTIVATVGLVFMLFRLFKNRPKANKLAELEDDAIVEIRESLADVKIVRRRKQRSNENQVRAVYQKFVMELQEAGFEIVPSMTSLDIGNLIKVESRSPEADILREIYIKVRYAKRAYSKEEIKQVKKVYKTLRNKIQK